MSNKKELLTLIEQLCKDLNQAHDQLMEAQEVDNPQDNDWPEWTPQANSIRMAENILNKRLAKTAAGSIFPSHDLYS